MKEKHVHSCNLEGDLQEAKRHTQDLHKRVHAMRKKDIIEVHTRLRKDDVADLYRNLRNGI